MAATFTGPVIHGQVIYQAGDRVPDDVPADTLESLRDRELVSDEAEKPARKPRAKKETDG